MAAIEIDSYRCSGCGTCVEMCPEVFRMDSMGEKVELVAAAFCPEKCIAVRE